MLCIRVKNSRSDEEPNINPFEVKCNFANGSNTIARRVINTNKKIDREICNLIKEM